MEEMLDLVECPCGGSILNGQLKIHPIFVEETTSDCHQIRCECGRSGIVSEDVDLVCVSWNNDFGGGTVSELTRSRLIDKYAAILAHTKLGVGDIKTELRSMFMEAGNITPTIKQARKVLRDAFKKDPDFRNSYIANISMRIFYDQLGMEDPELRDKISGQILDLIFEE
jgi:hypothetical protein